MKKLLLIIAIAEFFIISKAVAQEDPCTATCFTYRFCDGTSRGEVCTNDPYRVTIGGLKVKPQKLPSIPIRLCEDPFLLFFERPPNSGNFINFDALGADNQRHVIFDIDKQVDEIISAMNVWESICPEPVGPQPPECCITIAFSTNPMDFEGSGEDIKVLTGTSKIDQVMDFISCQPTCISPQLILLNATHEWFFGGPSAPPGLPFDNFQKMWYTGDTPDQSVVDRNRLKMYSMRSTLAHELGHWYGLGHTGGGDPTPGCEQKCAQSNQGIMSGSVANGLPHELSENEKCAFKKLYCWEGILSASDDNLINVFSVEVYPNPVTNKYSRTTILITAANASTATISIYDILGRVRYEIDRIEVLAGKITIHNLGNDLNSGIYHCMVKYKDMKGVVTGTASTMFAQW